MTWEAGSAQTLTVSFYRHEVPGDMCQPQASAERGALAPNPLNALNILISSREAKQGEVGFATDFPNCLKSRYFQEGTNSLAQLFILG